MRSSSFDMGETHREYPRSSHRALKFKIDGNVRPQRGGWIGASLPWPNTRHVAFDHYHAKNINQASRTIDGAIAPQWCLERS
jgi:hypothetical protein